MDAIVSVHQLVSNAIILDGQITDEEPVNVETNEEQNIETE